MTQKATPSQGTPLGADQADLAAVERIVRAAGTSFYRGMRRLPPDRRAAMYAIYAFCRIVDDIADEEGTLPQKRAGLAKWYAWIDDVYHGRGHDPVTRVLTLAVPAFDLRRDDFMAVIDGMRTDAENAMLAPDLVDLELYCDQVAVAVGRLSVRAFGDASPAADRVAHALGRALQLTNILRDVWEDAVRGRLYLPREFLEDAGVPVDLQSALFHPGFPKVCSRIAVMAHDYFREADLAMKSCDPVAMKPARLMGATYAEILSMLERRGWDRLRERVSLPLWRKLRLAIQHGLF